MKHRKLPAEPPSCFKTIETERRAHTPHTHFPVFQPPSFFFPYSPSRRFPLPVGNGQSLCVDVAVSPPPPKSLGSYTHAVHSFNLCLPPRAPSPPILPANPHLPASPRFSLPHVDEEEEEEEEEACCETAKPNQAKAGRTTDLLGAGQARDCPFVSPYRTTVSRVPFCAVHETLLRYPSATRSVISLTNQNSKPPFTQLPNFQLLLVPITLLTWLNKNPFSQRGREDFFE